MVSAMSRSQAAKRSIHDEREATAAGRVDGACGGELGRIREDITALEPDGASEGRQYVSNKKARDVYRQNGAILEQAFRLLQALMYEHSTDD